MLSCICVCVRDLGDSAGAGHEPGFVGGVSALVEVMSGEGVEREQRGEAVLWWLVGSCCVRGFCPGVPARWGGPWARLGAWALSFEIQIKIFILTFSAGRHAEPATAWIGSASRLLARKTGLLARGSRHGQLLPHCSTRGRRNRAAAIHPGRRTLLAPPFTSGLGIAG